MKRNRLWRGVLAAVLTSAVMSQSVLAQNVTAETKTEEEVTAAEVKVTGIRMEGKAYYSSWSVGDVLCNDSGVIYNVVQGMNLMVSYSDGSEAKIADSISQWIEKGVKAVVKDKSTGEEIKLDGHILQPGSYEAYLNYEGFSCKAMDFTVKPLEETVTATITVDSNTAAYEKDSDAFRKTVTKFVADEAGYYTFRAIREGNPDWKFSYKLQDEKGGYAASAYDTSLFTFLKAGTYYLKISSSYAFQLSVEEKKMEVTGITVSDSAFYNAWTVGDVSASSDSLMFDVVQGMNVLQIYQDGTKVKIGNSVSDLISEGVTATLKNKDTGSDIALDNKVLPQGSYEVSLHYQGFTCKAKDFTIKSLADGVAATITVKSNKAVYSSDSLQRPVTKFVADTPGIYTFRAARADNTDWKFSMELFNEKGERLSSGYDASLSKSLEAGIYYLKVTSFYAFTVSVEEKKAEITGITVSESPYHNNWTVGDVSANTSNILNTVIHGMDVLQAFDDGTKAKIGNTADELLNEGVTVALKDQDTGSEIALDNKVLRAGAYEVDLNYKDFHCKAADFTIKKVEDAVDAAITIKSNTASYEKEPVSSWKTVTKFVADKPGDYIFRAVRKGNTDWKFPMELLNAEGKQEAYEYGTPISKFLEAGTYYLKVNSYYAFTVSVEEKGEDMTGIAVSGSSYYDTWSVGDVRASNVGILSDVVSGMDVMEVLEDGTKVKIGDTVNQLVNAGVTVMIKNKNTGSTVSLDNQILPAGVYEVYLQYQESTCKAMDFTILNIEDAVNGRMDLQKNNVNYDKDSNLFRKTVTKFVAASPGYYTFHAEAKGNSNAKIQIGLYHKEAKDQKTQGLAESMKVYLKAGTYYFKTISGDAHTVSVSGKEIRSMKMEAPQETERLYLIGETNSWEDITGTAEDHANSLYRRTKIQFEYKDGSSETRSLSELYHSWNLAADGARIWNVQTGELAGGTQDSLKTGIYGFRYWIDTSKPVTEENADLDYNFIIYKGFQDVALTDWFVYPVAYVSAAGMMTGMGDGTNFGPAENLSRAQFATILYRMEGSPDVTYREVFPDVKDEEFYTNAVLWANENKVVTGYADTGTFGPADNITREQMAVMMYRFAQYKGYNVSESIELDSFPDHEKVSEFAQKAMKWASATGLIRGDQGNINPQGNASRAQCATIMMRFSEKYRN